LTEIPHSLACGFTTPSSPPHRQETRGATIPRHALHPRCGAFLLIHAAPAASACPCHLARQGARSLTQVVLAQAARVGARHFAGAPVSSMHWRRALFSKQQGDIALKTHIASICFRCFKCMLQVFRMNVAKVDWDVAYVAMVIHVYCKRLFAMCRCFVTRQVNLYVCHTVLRRRW
jgi:hypothetical protein